jgi:tRNA U34 5-carboxymethylaminomethyl modifying GTPase MnmE/TrmE
VEQWQQEALQLAARAEAAIDYAEDDIPVDTQLSRDCGA